MRTGTILVIDDNVEISALIARLLRRDGHTVELATTGAEGLARLAQGGVDAVLLDIVMPGMSGYDVLSAIKRDPSRSHVPVVMISSLDELEAVVRCIQLGADDYVGKPFEPTLLKARLDALLDRKLMRDRELAWQRLLESERQRISDVLESVLPRDVAQRLKSSGAAAAEEHEDVSVLVADIAGFNALFTHVPAFDLVAWLNDLFRTFDARVDARRVVKVKTVADAYLAVAGLPGSRQDHATALCELAIDLNAAIAACPAPNGQQVSLRIGIASGSVVAGVVGSTRISWDLWGPVVGAAFQLEGAAAPGGVLVTEAVARAAVGFRFEPAGFADVKGAETCEIFRLV